MFRMWPSYVRDRLSSTYAYLAASLGVTAVSGVAAARSPLIMRLTAGGGILVSRRGSRREKREDVQLSGEFEDGDIGEGSGL